MSQGGKGSLRMTGKGPCRKQEAEARGPVSVPCRQEQNHPVLPSPESAVELAEYQSWEDYELKATGCHGTCVSRDGARSQMPDRDSCSPALSISV